MKNIYLNPVIRRLGLILAWSLSLAVVVGLAQGSEETEQEAIPCAAESAFLADLHSQSSSSGRAWRLPKGTRGVIRIAREQAEACFAEHYPVE